MSEKISPSSPVFYDPRGRRWRHVRRTYLALGVAVTAITAIFIASVLANPLLPRLNLRPLQNLPRASDIKPQPPAVLPSARAAKAKRAQAELLFVVTGNAVNHRGEYCCRELPLGDYLVRAMA